MRFYLILLALFCAGETDASSLYAQAPKLLEVESQGVAFSGLPIQWGSERAILMDRLGAFHFFDVPAVKHRVLSQDYVPLGAVETRSHLQLELGKGFEVFVSGPYVIATPRGEATRWRQRFQSLLAGYTRYFHVRRWTLRRVDFPLIVIVFPSRQQFLSYARTQTAGQLPTQAVGSYFPKTNRCIAYQLSGGQGIDWNETEATIVHEAVHQLAYNTGIHERLFKNPTWFVEGLATMFETPAVYDLGLDRGQVVERIDKRQLATLAKLFDNPSVLEQSIESLIVSDDLFRSNPELAYALAWGMTFYFAERMPAQYQAFMRAQERRGMETYSLGQRRQDFARATRTSSGLLAVQMVRFYESLLTAP